MPFSGGATVTAVVAPNGTITHVSAPAASAPVAAQTASNVVPNVVAAPQIVPLVDPNAAPVAPIPQPPLSQAALARRAIMLVSAGLIVSQNWKDVPKLDSIARELRELVSNLYQKRDRDPSQITHDEFHFIGNRVNDAMNLMDPATRKKYSEQLGAQTNLVVDLYKKHLGLDPFEVVLRSDFEQAKGGSSIIASAASGLASIVAAPIRSPRMR